MMGVLVSGRDLLSRLFMSLVVVDGLQVSGVRLLMESHAMDIYLASSLLG